MSSRRPRRSSPRRFDGPTRLGVAATLVVLLLGILGVKWLQTDDGRFFLADHGVASALHWVEPRLEGAILDGLAEAQVTPDSLDRTQRRVAGPIILRLATDEDLTLINWRVSEAVRAAGGRVHRGHRWRGDYGEVLELQMGTPHRLTHRLLVQRGDVMPEAPPLPLGRLALVVDDLGHNLGPLVRRVLDLDAPVTLAILPNLSHSRDALREVSRAGKQALLHMPMEPDPGAPVPPGDRFVAVGMRDYEIEDLVSRCLDELPGVQGLNNHMGSRVTRSRPEMTAVMRVLQRRGLIFLDSMTTSKSVAYHVAADLGVPSVRNELFVDRETTDPEKVRQRLDHLADIARDRGYAVGIGHVHEATVEALESFVAAMRPGDVELVFLADLIHDRAAMP